MDTTDTGAATLSLASPVLPNRVPMKAQVLEALYAKRVNDQIAGHGKLLRWFTPSVAASVTAPSS